MLGERPVAEYGIVIAALAALVLVVRAILSHLRYVHDTTPKGNSSAVMKAHVEDIANQMDKMVLIWNPDRAKRQDEMHASLLKMETLNIHKDEVMKDLLKESRKTNTLLERLITHVIVDPWNPPNKK